jgi:ribokinase
MSLEPGILAIGNINTDLTFYLEKNPEPDSEAFARDFSSFHGGSASNFAVGVSRLGMRSGMVGCVGDDRFGEEAVRALQREGVSTDLVKVIKGERTGAVCVLVETGGKRMMVAYRGANMRLPEAVEGIGEAMPDVLQISNVSRMLLSTILKQVKGTKGKTLVSLDPGGASGELAVGDLEGLDVLLLNEKECKAITKKTLMAGAKVLASRVKTVVVKRGGNGCLLLSEGGVEEIPAFEVDVQDPTGAGDAFGAGFIAGVVSGKCTREAALWGSAVAAMKIAKRGAWAGLPSRAGLAGFLKAHRD